MDLNDMITGDMVLDKEKKKDPLREKRQTAYSWACGYTWWWYTIPGLGFLPLRKFHCFVWSLAGLAAAVISFYPLFTGLMGMSPLLLISCFVNALLFFLLDCWISIIETEFQCNLMGLAYIGPAQNKKNGVYDTKIKNYGKAYRLSISISAGIGILCALAAGFTDGFSNYVSAMLILWISVALVGNYFAGKYRNVLAKDMECPFIESECATKNIESWKKAKAGMKTDAKSLFKKENRLALIVLLILAAFIIGAIIFMIVMISQH